MRRPPTLDLVEIHDRLLTIYGYSAEDYLNPAFPDAAKALHLALDEAYHHGYNQAAADMARTGAVTFEECQGCRSEHQRGFMAGILAYALGQATTYTLLQVLPTVIKRRAKDVDSYRERNLFTSNGNLRQSFADEIAGFRCMVHTLKALAEYAERELQHAVNTVLAANVPGLADDLESIQQDSGLDAWGYQGPPPRDG
jgi:hypothetical protein